MRHHHVAVGAGLLVERRALSDAKSLRHVDLHMVDEIAVPDRLEQAVAKTEGQNVLRRLLAEEVVDAEDLILWKNLVQAPVERDGAFEIDAERLFHDDARSRHQPRFREHLDGRKRRARRHAEIMQAVDFRRVVALGPRHGFGERRSAFRLRHVVEQFREGRPRAVDRAARRELFERATHEFAEAFDVEIVERHADHPAVGQKAGGHQMKQRRP